MRAKQLCALHNTSNTKDMVFFCGEDIPVLKRPKLIITCAACNNYTYSMTNVGNFSHMTYTKHILYYCTPATADD